jgi:hypothetical protein
LAESKICHLNAVYTCTLYTGKTGLMTPIVPLISLSLPWLDSEQILFFSPCLRQRHSCHYSSSFITPHSLPLSLLSLPPSVPSSLPPSCHASPRFPLPLPLPPYPLIPRLLIPPSPRLLTQPLPRALITTDTSQKSKPISNTTQ